MESSAASRICWKDGSAAHSTYNILTEIFFRVKENFI